MKGYKSYVSQTIGGIPVTVSGMLAGAHLVGAGAVREFLRSGGTKIPRDGNGVPVTEYMKMFGGYDFPVDGSSGSLDNPSGDRSPGGRDTRASQIALSAGRTPTLRPYFGQGGVGGGGSSPVAAGATAHPFASTNSPDESSDAGGSPAPGFAAGPAAVLAPLYGLSETRDSSGPSRASGLFSSGQPSSFSDRFRSFEDAGMAPDWRQSYRGQDGIGSWGSGSPFAAGPPAVLSIPDASEPAAPLAPSPDNAKSFDVMGLFPKDGDWSDYEGAEDLSDADEEALKKIRRVSSPLYYDPGKGRR